MKKFLSSLLALTMILSLVIVPANAVDDSVDQDSFSVSVKGGKTSATVGEDVTFVANVPSTVTVTDGTDSTKKYPGTVTYSWTVGSGYTAGEKKDGAEFTATAKTAADSGTAVKATCTFTVSYDKNEDANESSRATKSSINFSKTVECKVITAQAAFENSLKTAKVTFNGREYAINNDWSTTVKYFEGETSDLLDENEYGCTLTGSRVSLSNDGKKLTVSNSDKSLSKDITLKTEKAVTTSPTITVNYGDGLHETREGQKTELSVSYTATTSSPVTYKWKFDSTPKANSNKSTYDCSEISAGTYVVTVEIYEGSTLAVTSNQLNLEVKADPYKNKITAKSGYETSMVANQTQPLEITIANPAAGTDYSVKWNSSKTDIATINESGKVGTLTALNKTGSTKVTATVTYLNKDYTVTFDTISVQAADTKFEGIKNGGADYYTDDQLKDMVVSAINKISSATYDDDDVESIKIKTLPSHVTLYDGEVKSTKALRVNADLTSYDRIYYAADDGYIDADGDNTQLIVDVKLTDAGTPTVTITIPVTSAGDIKETVTGSSANSSVSFDVDDVVDYDKVYIRGSVSGSGSSRTFTPSSLASSDYDGYWDGNAKSGSGWVLFDDDDTVTIPASAFSRSTGKVTLYVVGIDDDDVAYTGTIEVSQKSYAIEYNVVAGESVSFDQKAFEDFMDDYADDNISTSRGDYFEFDYVKFSLPSSTSGTLYEGSSKIKASDEISDLDKVSFDSTAKAKGTINISFTLYAKRYDKNDKVVDKKVTMSGVVAITVVNEDIVYEVGVNSYVTFDSSHFQSFLNSSSTSYKRATLDYVTFDVGSNKAVTSYFSGTGALYRSYSVYGINTTVDSKDEFHYNPKSTSKNYDLDDVTYVTSRFAKAGDIVYIPFTAYGTRNEKAEGTVAIKVKQTMNFTDVHTYDYFYDAVQWAVNNDITKGTSTTTFSPKQGCTRAQLVTFLWRAAKSPEPRSSYNKFTDVTASHADYMKAIIWATEQGITTGTSTTTFSPDATCTRAQIVTFLYRFKNSPAVYGSVSFSDVNKAEHGAYYNAILWASNNKIATGYNNIFDPNGTCNRGDAVTFLYRALA